MVRMDSGAAGSRASVDIGRPMGYKDGSAIFHLLQLLDEEITKSHSAQRAAMPL